jgi:hypothetical protein
VYVDGEPLAANEMYNVTLNSYMAGWTFGDRYGWNMSELPTVEADYTLYGTAVVEYIEANTPITPPDVDRIRRVTRTAGDVAVSNGSDSVTLTSAVPDAVERVDASTVHVENATGGSLAATDAEVSGGNLTATFDRDDVGRLAAESGTLELYATYNDSVVDPDRNGFDRSVLNGPVPLAELDDGTGDSVVDDYDADGYGEVEIGELQAAIDDWTDGDLAIGDLQTVVDAWASG